MSVAGSIDIAQCDIISMKPKGTQPRVLFQDSYWKSRIAACQVQGCGEFEREQTADGAEFMGLPLTQPLSFLRLHGR